MQKSKAQKEAELFGRYIIKKSINTETVDFYIKSLDIRPFDLNLEEEKTITKCITNPWKLPYFDAALSLSNPNHLLKQKLLRMFAILETRPEYADYFLGRDFPKSYFIKIGFVGLRAIYRAIIGIVIIRL